MYHADLKANKLILLPLVKTSNSDSLAVFEQFFLYCTLGKLAIGTNIVVRDFATQSSKQHGNFGISDPNTFQQMLQKTAQLHQSRYVLTGSISEKSSDEASLATNESKHYNLTLQLYDALSKSNVLEETRSIDSFKTQHLQAPSTEACLLPDINAFNTLVGWGVECILKHLHPEFTHESHLVNLTQQAFCNNYTALHLLIEGEYTHRSISKKTSAYETAIQHDPNIELAHLHLGKLYKSQQNYEKSVAAFQNALETSQGTGQLKAIYANEAGICRAILHDTPQAIEWWQQAIHYAPTFINPYINMAHHFEEAKELSQAEDALLQAQKALPDDPRTYYSLARIYSKMGEWSKALSQYQHQLSTDHKDPWCHCNIATCYLQIGDESRALIHFETTTKLAQPDSEAAQYATLVMAGITETGL